jgi:hypothetical protein
MFCLVPYDVDTKPGAWVERQAQRRLVYLLVGATFVAVFGVLAASLSHDYVLEALIFGVLVCVAIAAHDRIELAVPWLKGANAESAVGAELEELRRDGYIVMHDVMFGGEGNLDHIVSGPNGVFLVETKFKRYEMHQLTKVKRQAARVHDVLDHWVTPVVCAGVRKKRPYKHAKVWIAGRGQLADLIRGLEGRPVDPERLFRFADSLD